MKKYIILALVAPLFLACGNALLTDTIDSEWAGGQTVTTDPVEPTTPEEPTTPVEPTPEPDGGTTRLTYFTDKFLGHNDDPDYVPTIAYTWEYYNNPDEQHIYVLRVYNWDAETRTIGTERFRIPYPGIQFTGNERKIYGNGINIGGHNFLGWYVNDVTKFGRKIESIMTGRTGPWMSINAGYVDASKLEWVPDAVMTSIFYGEPYPQVYGAALLFNFADIENPLLEEVVISYDVWDNSQ
jgi:hypothetical protein